MSEAKVAFDVLMRAPGAGGIPHLDTIESLRPDPGAVEKCRRHLWSLGIEAHSTGFGLACTAPPALFEEVFGVSLERTADSPGTPPYQIVGDVQPPPEIAEHISRVTISAPPEFF